MEIKEKILKYLSMYGKENKYRIASVLKIDVSKATKALRALEEEGRIEVKGGRAFFVKEKKAITTKARKRKKKPKVEVKKEEPEEVPKEETKEEEAKLEEEQPEEEEEPKEEPEEVSEEPAKKEEERIEGTVKFFNPNKGFGFITGDDGKEYYVHESGLKEGITIKADDRVFFKIIQTNKGPKAEDVEQIGQTQLTLYTKNKDGNKKIPVKAEVKLKKGKLKAKVR